MSRVVIFILIIIIIPGLIYGEPPSKNYHQPSSQSSGIQEIIRSKLEQLSLNPDTITIGGEKFHSIEYVSNLYEKNDFQPFWTKPEYVEDAIKGISSSYEDGLLPLDYHLEAILVLKHQLALDSGSQEEKAVKLAELDLLLTDGVIFYADHLVYGKIDPVALIPTWNFEFAPIPDLNPATFTQYITNREIPYRLNDLRPSLFQYDTLLSILAQYRDIAGNGGWQPIPGGGKIEPGKKNSRIPAIRQRLLMTGELSAPDSVGSDIYDKMLEIDIKAFQDAHALDTDGIIGVGTFRELNVPVEERIAALRINLERVRWVARDLPETYIIVNIAAFWLLMVKDNQVVHNTTVVVGKPLNKTPVFRDKMRYIEFNPTWTLPTSIIKNEIIPKLKKDSIYLEKNHMVLLDTKGNLIPTSILDMKNLSASHFPYLVRQEPGPWNVLGEMKFMFPNKYDIYLHDTPSKILFNRSSRAFSHGCIRVNRPMNLAEKLLTGTKYDRKKINEIISTHITTRVNLPQPLDILLLYWTCGINKNGELFFVPDIYDRDQDVLRALDKFMH
ncbi:MAG: L,D-transpeptidase family protein [Bacteroidales bacterium]|nr:L,D-transpeptidase family protein [Bacteroidales bacterium]